jgi:hypothetical protein
MGTPVLVFIDESGCAQPKDPSPWWTLTAVCVPESSSRDLSRRLFAKVRSVYPKSDASLFEVKASELLARRQFEGSLERRALVAELTQLLETLPASVFAIRGKRPTIVPASPKLRVDPPNRLLIERIELLMRQQAQVGHLAKLVFDETGRGPDSMRSRSMRGFFHGTPEGKGCVNVLDVPFFVSSAITPGIQLADLMAGAIRHHQILRDQGSAFTTDWEKAILRLYEVARTHTQDFKVTTGGSTETYYGLYRMPDSYYATAPGMRSF